MESFYTGTPIADIKAHYGPGDGRHWFDPSTMRFFKTRFVGKAYGVGPAYGSPVLSFFVTSEQRPGADREYSVRCYDWAKRSISTVGEFGGYATPAKAKLARERACNAVFFSEQDGVFTLPKGA